MPSCMLILVCQLMRHYCQD
ncbi:uncharacterized protein FTOL_01573 [Fusarium torulosum]|uniref:Uncharacterized protein n=1 Tax=Fusarium torulosum TaxID=33205 RepID=A0AAE8M0G5_9HYPO|nr:uncharacterized protein FTOL_01573 [Fusarium torulosum]